MAASTRIAVALLVTLLTLVASACSTKRTALVAPPTSAPIRHVLFNGVRVIIEEHRTSDVVAVQLWVKAGGRDEVANELGLAHYLEHMLFKGTPTRPGRLIDREVEGTGGRMNAGTSLDFTYYHMVLPASRAVAGVEILADIGVNASLDEPLLEAEKRVVLEEIRLGEDSPMRFLFKKTYESVFDGHPYGRPVIGTPELIRALTREQLVRHRRRIDGVPSLTLTKRCNRRAAHCQRAMLPLYLAPVIMTRASNQAGVSSPHACPRHPSPISSRAPWRCRDPGRRRI